MKRRKSLEKIALFIPAFAISCSGNSIETSIGPENNQISEKTLVKKLNTQPYATWSPSGNIIFPLYTYLKLIDKTGLDLTSIKILSDIGDENKSISHPNWEENTISFQLNYLNENKSEIYSSLIKPGFAVNPEKLNFDLPEGKFYKYEYPTLSPDTNFIAFTFNDEMYLSEYPPTGKATHIPLSNIINDYCEEVGMYSWSRDGEKIAFTAKTSEGTNIYVMDNIPSREIYQLTKGNFHDYNPSWSCDSNFIAFDSNRYLIDDKHSIFNSDGSNLKKLSKGSGEYPKCNPNTNELLYSLEIADGWRINLIYDAI